MRNGTRTPLALVLALMAGACQDEPLGPPGTPAPQAAVNGAGGLAVYNGGVDRAVPAAPCLADDRYRQFDFWLGEWNVGAFGATNIIESLYDGCVIAESWTSGQGIRGRSINTYDRDTGQWHQTWVTQLPWGYLRMSGGLDAGGVMILDGTRQALPGPVRQYDRYTWTQTGPDQVVQAFSWDYGANGGTGSGSLTYDRAPSVTPLPEWQLPLCQPGNFGGGNRLLDFFHGTWSVARENGSALGQAEVSGDLTGCVTEEDYSTPKGYGAISFLYYDNIVERWFRTIIDSEGERMELTGSFENGALVLAGHEPAPGGRSYHVRNTIEEMDAMTVRQTWEVSSDGQEWTTDMVLTFTRQ